MGTMRVVILFADYPAGALTGMGIVACTVGAGLLCVCVAGAIRLGATDVTFRRRAVRGWLIAAGVCVLVSAVLPVTISFLDLARAQLSFPRSPRERAGLEA
jgi:hypothetical protein